jgi:hypothetical protein
MNQDSKFKKLLKEEIKLILIQEGWKEKLAGYAGAGLTGLALGGLFGIAPEEGERSERNRERIEQAETDIIKTILLSAGLDSIDKLNELNNQDLIAAILIIIERMETESGNRNFDRTQKALLIDLQTRLMSTIEEKRIQSLAPGLLPRLRRITF